MLRVHAVRTLLSRTAFVTAAALAIPLGCKSSGDGGHSGPWYDTTLDPDTSYLPMGSVAHRTVAITFSAGGKTAHADGYVPDGGHAPIVVMLPGAAIVKERYYWLGELLASHGVAVFVAQPVGTFSDSDLTTGLLAELARENADASSPIAGAIDPTRLVLAGHSQGAVVQAGLTDIATCPTGFCSAGTKTPDGLRGMLLMGFHNQASDDDTAPMPAAEIPWLILSGSAELEVTSGKTQKTFDRIRDRPLYDVEVEGMSHYQFTDYVDPKVDAVDTDGTPTIGNKAARATAGTYAVAFVKRVLLGDSSVADDLGTAGDARVKLAMKSPHFTHADDTGLPRIFRDELGMAGLDGDPGSCDVVASKEMNGALYLLVRNESGGSEVWRVNAGKVEQVLFPNGVTKGVYGNKQLNSLVGAMEVFQGKLYVGFSSGVQGSTRGSTGAELWAYDGTTWTPIVANRASDPSVTVGGIASCDGTSHTAVLTAQGAAWQPDQWKGAVLDDIDAKTGNALVLDVVSNDASTLTVATLENGVASNTQNIDCSKLPLADGTRALKVGETLRLRKGLDHNGFGQSWNKAITAMAVLGDKLYVGTGLNYMNGAEIYATGDGTTFEVVVPRAKLAVADATQAATTSSIIAMHVSSLDGAPKLYFSGNGNGGYGARLFALDGAGTLTPLIDNGAGNAGRLAAGLGVGLFHIPSIVDFGGRLWLGGFSGNGLQIFSAARFGAGSDLRVEIGDGAPIGVGFGDPNQISASLDVVRNQLWVGSVMGSSQASDLLDKSALSFRSVNGTSWQLTSAHAFGDNAISTTRIVDFGGSLIAMVGNGKLTAHACFAPLQLYTLREEGAH